MTTTKKKGWIGFSSALALGLAVSGSVLAIGGGGGGGGGNAGFADLLQRSSQDGRCSVNRVSVGQSTLYIPTDPSNPNAQFNVMVWGNGTGGDQNTYGTLLSSVATQCIAVAAANTANSGSGVEMAQALQDLRNRFPNVLRSNARICTSGHSQGGGGSFNAAPRVNADCVIPVQPDTRFTVTINAPVGANVEVISLTGSADNLAPAGPNRGNVEGNSTILTQVTTQGEDHFVPTNGRAGIIGNMFRMANIAELSTDPALSQEFRRAFFGPDNDNRADADNADINDVRINAAAEATAP